jgi:hypothetical protein
VQQICRHSSIKQRTALAGASQPASCMSDQVGSSGVLSLQLTGELSSTPSCPVLLMQCMQRLSSAYASFPK